MLWILWTTRVDAGQHVVSRVQGVWVVDGAAQLSLWTRFRRSHGAHNLGAVFPQDFGSRPHLSTVPLWKEPEGLSVLWALVTGHLWMEAASTSTELSTAVDNHSWG